MWRKKMNRSGGLSGLLIGGTAAVFFLIAVTPASALVNASQVPASLKGVGITEHLNKQVPLNLHFTDENGQDVVLKKYFQGNKPVILDLGYYECPMLCGLVLKGLTTGLEDLDWTVGGKFNIVNVSINPLETSALAKMKKQNTLKEYARPKAASGWHFLTGQQKDIKALTDAVGFGYKWDKKAQKFAHVAALVVLTPDGKVSRYLYGVQFKTADLRLALLEASKGKIGSTIDRFILFCHQYDPSSGTYTLAAMNVMRAGGAVTLVIMGIAGLILWRLEVRRRRRRAAAAEVVAQASEQSSEQTPGDAPEEVPEQAHEPPLVEAGHKTP